MKNNEQKKLHITMEIELIDVDLFDLNEDFKAHNSFFLTMLAGLLIILIAIFTSISNLFIVLMLGIPLSGFLIGAIQFFYAMDKLVNKMNKLSDKKKGLIKKKYSFI